MARSMLQKAVGIPKCAISVSRSFRADNVVNQTPKRQNTGKGKSTKTLTLRETAVSDEEDLEDLTFLFSEDEAPAGNEKAKVGENRASLVSPSKTEDFINNVL